MNASRLTRRQVLASSLAGVTALVTPWESSRAAAAPAAAAGTVKLGGDLVVNRMGFGAMRITGPDIWGEPKDPAEARRVLHRALDLGVNFFDTADAYGPNVSELLIAFDPVSVPARTRDRHQGRFDAAERRGVDPGWAAGAPA